MGTIVHLDDYRNNKKKRTNSDASVLFGEQTKEQKLQMRPLGRRKSPYPELKKKQERKDLSDHS